MSRSTCRGFPKGINVLQRAATLVEGIEMSDILRDGLYAYAVERLE